MGGVTSGKTPVKWPGHKYVMYALLVPNASRLVCRITPRSPSDRPLWIKRVTWYFQSKITVHIRQWYNNSLLVFPIQIHILHGIPLSRTLPCLYIYLYLYRVRYYVCTYRRRQICDSGILVTRWTSCPHKLTWGRNVNANRKKTNNAKGYKKY